MTFDTLKEAQELKKDFDLCGKIIDSIDGRPEETEGLVIVVLSGGEDLAQHEIRLSKDEATQFRALLQKRRAAAVDTFDGL